MQCVLFRGRRDVYFAGLAQALHAAGQSDGVAEETVARHLPSHDTSHRRPRVNTNPDLKDSET